MKIAKLSNDKKWLIYGAIRSVFNLKDDEFEFEIEEEFPNDPWIASIKIGPLTTKELMYFHKHYCLDPDKKGIPYYFMAEDINSKEEFVMFSSDKKLYPIEKAKDVGRKKGLKEEQLDF